MLVVARVVGEQDTTVIRYCTAPSRRTEEMSILDSVAYRIDPRAWKSSQIGSSCVLNPSSNASV